MVMGIDWIKIVLYKILNVKNLKEILIINFIVVYVI